jgi:hypothetical protein
MMTYLLFAKPGFETESPVELFRGVFATIEDAQASFATLNEYGAEVVLFDGEQMTLVSEYPIWLRNPPGMIPIGHEEIKWGMSDA